MSIRHRIYGDYLMASRMDAYAELLQAACDAGYEHLTLSAYYALLNAGTVDASKKYFLHRHDIDSDIRTARRFFEAEKKLGIKTSYYFRLCTWAPELMEEIEAYGSEATYHYEELAQYCKDRNIREAEKAKAHFPQVREVFRQNFRRLSATLSYPMKSIASHGDFVNRKLGLPNYTFVTRELLDELGIVFECYEDRLLKSFTSIHSDTMPPAFYRPANPHEAIKRGDAVVYLLTHPRHWHTAAWENTKDNVFRFYEGLKYRF